MTPRLESRIFYALLVLACLPVWLTPYFPSNDGPEHLHNAFALLHLNSPGYEIFRHYYTLNPTPNPNWIGHLILAGFMTVVSPLTSAKIFLTCYLISFCIAARYALTAVNKNAAYLSPLAIPLAYNWFYHMGFYNFCFSLAIFLLVMGYYFKHHARLTWPRLIVLGILLLALFFCHLSAVIMALAVIAALSLWISLINWLFPPLPSLAASPSSAPEVTTPPSGKNFTSAVILPQIRLLIIALPVLVLTFLFFLNNHGQEEISRALTFYERLRFYAIFICSFSRAEALISVTILGLLAILILLSPRQLNRFRIGLFLLVITAAALGLFLPANIARGGFIYQRLVFFVVLLFFLFAAGKSPSTKLRNTLWVCSLVLALGACTYYTLCYYKLSDYVAEYVSIAHLLPDNSTILPVAFQENPKDPAGRDLSFTTNPFRHTAGLLGAGRPIIDLDNYEAEVGYFPLLWKPDLNPYTFLRISDITSSSRLQYLTHVDYVYLWIAGPGSQPPWAPAVLQQLHENYTLIYTTSPRAYGQLWKRNPTASQPATTP